MPASCLALVVPLAHVRGLYVCTDALTNTHRDPNQHRGVRTEVVKQAAERAHQQGRRETNLIRIKEVSASRGKAMRAEPVSLLYEKQRVLHRRGLDQLEAEMMAFSREWDRSVDGSPNWLDAMIWGITRLSKIITQVPIA